MDVLSIKKEILKNKSFGLQKTKPTRKDLVQSAKKSHILRLKMAKMAKFQDIITLCVYDV